MLDGGDGWLGRHHAFQKHGRIGRLVNELNIVPTENTLDRRGGLRTTLPRKIAERQRQTKTIAAVGFAIAGNQGIDGQDDCAVAECLHGRRFRGLAHEYSTGAEY